MTVGSNEFCCWSSLSSFVCLFTILLHNLYCNNMVSKCILYSYALRETNNFLLFDFCQDLNVISSCLKENLKYWLIDSLIYCDCKLNIVNGNGRIRLVNITCPALWWEMKMNQLIFVQTVVNFTLSVRDK